MSDSTPNTEVERLTAEVERLRAALRRIADAESGHWGVIARKALKDGPSS